MSKYVIAFSKTGTICFTSHLDLMRIFKRGFKRTGIPLAYSQGFNPHPKMGFAQPLSLGYWGMEEYIEFETEAEWEPLVLMTRLQEGMPEGVDLLNCLRADKLTKTLAAHTQAAQYMIQIPAEGLSDPHFLWHSYMDRDTIDAWKRQKKKKDLKRIDIKPMIRDITFTPAPEALYVDTILDSGSNSNLSPELVVTTVMDQFGIGTDRSEVSIMRKQIFFDQPLKKLL